jgi:hypothetical protein
LPLCFDPRPCLVDRVLQTLLLESPQHLAFLHPVAFLHQDRCDPFAAVEGQVNLPKIDIAVQHQFVRGICAPVMDLPRQSAYGAQNDEYNEDNCLFHPCSLKNRIPALPKITVTVFSLLVQNPTRLACFGAVLPALETVLHSLIAVGEEFLCGSSCFPLLAPRFGLFRFSRRV